VSLAMIMVFCSTDESMLRAATSHACGLQQANILVVE
jgi:hypothetical protein